MHMKWRFFITLGVVLSGILAMNSLAVADRANKRQRRQNLVKRQGSSTCPLSSMKGRQMNG